jgi:N-acetylornithine carbamoyltransferase
MKRFVDLAELGFEETSDLLRLAGRFEKEPLERPLAGKVLGLLFFNPSLRTLASFQSGMARLGGTSFVITPGAGTWQLEWRDGAVMDGTAAEHIREAIPVLASYSDVLGIRSFAGLTDLASDLSDEVFLKMAELSPVPVINMESAIQHPCQGLADWKTLDDLGVPGAARRAAGSSNVRRGRFVLTWAYHPKPLPLAVPATALHMAALRGMEVMVLRPEGFELPNPVMEKARSAAALSGGSVNESSDPREAMEGADVVYAKSWSSTRYYGDTAADAELRRTLRDWRVSESWFKRAQPECRFMHCLPVRRGVVVEDQVLDGPRSVVIPQARNRMLVQMAVLHRLLAESSTTRRDRLAVKEVYT